MIESILEINTDELKLTDLVELEVLQKIQDAFATSFNLPSFIYDKKGNAITQPSCFTEFCRFIRSSEKGKLNCQQFDNEFIIELSKSNVPIVRKGCVLKNIITATAPIRIDNIHLANFGIGQILDKELDKHEIESYAKSLDLDFDILNEKIKTLLFSDKEKLEKAIAFLSVLTQQISLLGFQNLQNKILLQKQRDYEKEIALEHSNFKAVFNNNYLAYIIIDKEFRVSNYNEVSKKISAQVFNFQLDKAKSIYDFIIPFSKDEFESNFKKALAGEFVLSEEEFTTQKGKQRWFLFEFVPMTNYKNEIDRVCLIMFDTTDWKNAEILSKTNQKLYQLLAENSNDVVWLLDMDFKFVYLSPSTERLFGYNPEERKKLTMTDIYKPETIARLKTLFKQKQIEYYENKRNEAEIIEIEGRHKDGHPVFFEISAKFVLDDLGVIVGVQGTSHDITERKFSEFISKLILDLYSKSDTYETKQILELCIQNAIEITQSEVGFIYFTDKEQRESMEIGNLPVDFAKNKQFFCEDSIKLKIPFDYNNYDEFAREKAFSKEIPFFDRLLTLPIFQADEVVAVLGLANKKSTYKQFDIDVLNNITTNLWNIIRRRNAEILTRKLQKAVESAKTCIVITNLKGEIEYANPYFTETTGYLRDEYVGKNPSILKSGVHSEEYYRSLWKTIKSGQTWEGEFCNKKKNNDLYWENVVISPITNYKNKITHFVAVKTDISEYKKITKELIEAKERAEESDRLKSAFLRNISHEVRTPMNAIVGFSSLMLRPEIAKEKRVEFTAIVHQSVNKLLAVIENMIILAHIETKQLKINKIEFNPSHLILQLFDDYKLLNRRVLEKNIKFSVTETIDNCLNFSTDYTFLQQIVRIFLDNAFKFTKQGEIQLGCRLIDKKIEFFIKDTGIGIPKEKQHLIFRRFSHADENVTQHFGGIGLGISIASGLIKLLDGVMFINSEVNLGTEIIFTLPISEPLSFDIQKHNEQLQAAKIKAINILVAEDEEFNFQYIHEILESYDFNLLHAINGQEAVELFKKHTIDIVLMDLKMPIMDGFEAAAEIRSIDSTIPIIAQTAFAHKREACLSADFTDYISKPFSKEQFIRILDKYIHI